MARRASSALFNLIKSLKKSEKRYINLFIGAHFVAKNNKYLEMYGLLLKQKEFNDNVLKQKLYPEGVNSNTFAENKRYLYNLLLKLLIDYDEFSSKELKLESEIQKINILFKRGLIKESEELILRLEKQIKLMDDALLSLKLMDWKAKIAISKHDTTRLERYGSQHDSEMQVLIERLKTEYLLKHSYYALHSIKIKYSDRKNADIEQKIEEIMKGIPEKVSQSGNYKEQKWYLKVISYYNLLIDNTPAFYFFCKKLFLHIKDNEKDIQGNLEEYIQLLDWLVLSCCNYRKYDEAKQHLPEYLKLSEAKLTGEIERKRAICSYYINSAVISNLSGNIEEGESIIHKFSEKYTQEFYKPFQINVNLCFFNFYFNNSKFEEALKFLDNIVNGPTSQRKDILAVSRCLYLIVHYELGNLLMLSSLIRSTGRFIKKDYVMSKFEFRLIRLIKDLINIPDSRTVKAKLFKEFFHDVNVIFMDDKERKVLKYIFFDAWAESKVKECSIMDVLASKNKN